MDDREDRLGPPTPARILEQLAEKLRVAADIGYEPKFGVVEALWRLAKLPGPLHALAIIPRTDEEMGAKEAWASGHPPRISIRQSRLEYPHDAETRFILAHELCHVVLHPDVQSFRMAGGNEKFSFLCKDDLLAIYHNDESHEVQADVAARAFLMPARLVRECSSPTELAKRCATPLREAKIRYAQICTAKRSPNEVRSYLAEQKKEQKLSLWTELRKIPNEDPSVYRQAGLYRIAWLEFGRMTECGWTIESGQVVPYLDIAAGRLGR
jgi:uncharacterized protein DUF955